MTSIASTRSSATRERRYKMFHVAEMRVLDARIKVHVLNLSRTGLLVRTETPPPEGSVAIFDLGATERRGRIVWIEGDRCGVQFCVPVEEADMARLLGPPSATRVPARALSDRLSVRLGADRI